MWYVDGDGWTGNWAGGGAAVHRLGGTGPGSSAGQDHLIATTTPSTFHPPGGGASAGGWSVERVYQLGKIPSLHCVNLTIDSQRILRHNLTMQCRALSSASLGGT